MAHAKRTKRYGGFLVGDRVRVKGKYYEWLKEGEITGLVDGYCSVYFTENTKMLGEPVVFAFMPNQLINLTRQEEERLKEIHEELDRRERDFVSKESVKFVELNKDKLDKIWGEQLDTIRFTPSDLPDTPLNML